MRSRSLPFDEGAGTLARDASGQGNDAKLLNGAGGSGRLGGSLALDGVDDIAAVSDGSRAGGLGAALTAAWVQRTTAQSGWRLAARGQLTTTSGRRTPSSASTAPSPALGST